MSIASIPFIDLAEQRRRLGPAIDDAMLRVAEHGAFIMGPEVQQLEAALRTFSGAREAISCANGTDAIALALMAKEVRRGDAIFVPSFTFAATAEVVAWIGATPVFVDVRRDTFNMDVESLKVAIADARRLGFNPAGVITVDLFGQPADYDALLPVAEENDLWLVCDAAQSFGATYKGRKVGSIGLATTTSFFPAKPLGCYGDGGAVFTQEPELASVMRSLRVHGQGEDKYDNVRIGINGRLDTIQASILLEKLRIFPEEIESRRRVAGRYSASLLDWVDVPAEADGCRSVWAQYTVRVRADSRSAVVERLKGNGIPTAIYYPKPLHQQTAYRDFPAASSGLSVSEALAREVVSLPMHPYLDEETQDTIVRAVQRAVS